MNPVVSVYLSYKPHRLVLILQLALVVIFVLVTACGGGSAQQPTTPQGLLTGTAFLTCSEQCAARGQCGTIPDGQQAILGNSIGPDTTNHDRLFPNGTQVNIVGNEVRVVQVVNDPSQQMQVPFYAVATLDNTKAGWVIAWCIAAP